MSAARQVNRESRRDELIHAAVQVFFRKGVISTAVSDIVKEAGVAQGTFYLYFSSKEDIIDAAAETIADQLLDSIVGTVNACDGSAVDKVLALRDGFLSIGDDPETLEMAELYHRPENRATHDRMADRLIRQLVPLVEAIVLEGVNEGAFSIEHPHIAAWHVLGSMHVLEHASMNPAELQDALIETTSYALRALGYTEGHHDNN